LLTSLDTQSWAKELVTGNAQFVEISAGSPPTSTIYVVSNVRADNSFVVLQSSHTPPIGFAPGPGSNFLTVATYTFLRPNSGFDPVTAYDSNSGLLHIIGTQNNAINSRYSDLIKFTFNTNTQVLSGPHTLTTASAVRDGYDMVVLTNGHRFIAVSVLDATMVGAEVPPLFQAPITHVGITTTGTPAETTLTITGNNTFSEGQLATLTGLTNATFLNGLTVQVLSATPTQFTAAFTTNFPDYFAADIGLVTPFYSGENLIAFELDTNDNYVPGSLHVVASSPDRSGDTFSAVSLVTPDGVDIELYFGSHPKVYNFKDQLFAINLINRTSGTWDVAPTNLFAFTARYADDSLTVIPDLFGNRYLNWSFWTQSDHPEGLIGNVMLGTLQVGNPWLWNPIYGTSLNGSVVQATLSVTQFGTVSLAYLLEPFNPVISIPAMGTFPAYPLFVATVTPTLGTLNTSGWYNQQVFTWLRGTNSAIDNASMWAFVGEAARLISITNEAQTIPASGVVQVNNFSDTPFSNFWENVRVIYSQTGVPLVEVATAPAKGQYQVEPTNGRYIFNLVDVGVGVQISYTYVGIITPVYVSLFNVPPIVGLPLCGPPMIVYRDTGSPLGQPVTLSAAGTSDPDQDAIEYWWSNNDTTGFVTLTPSGLWTPSVTSTLSVSPQIGGAEETFNVGVAAVDLYPDLVTQRHPPLNVTGYQILVASPPMVEFTVSNTPVGSPPTNTPTLPLAIGEEIMTWDIMTLSPPSLVQSLNDQAWYVIASTSTTFTAIPLCGMSGSPPTPPSPSPVTTELGSAANYALLAYSGITNASPSTSISNGVIGSAPIMSITGFNPPAATVDNADAPAARLAGNAAFGYYSGLPPTQSGLADLSTNNGGGGVGVYHAGVFSGGALDIPTSITLDAQGNSDAVFVFISASTTKLESGASIILANGAQAANVVWVVGSSFTSIWNGISSDMVGNILAYTSITLGGGTFSGRALAVGGGNGAVTISTAEAITVPASGPPPGPVIGVTGYAIPQFQFAVITIVVPYNAPPEIVFPSPVWEAVGSPPVANTLVSPAEVARNTQIMITSGTIINPLTQFPVEYFGISDPDDIVTYAWSQVSGTPVTIVGASNLPTFAFDTNGVALQGESLVFELTLCDGVNPCTTVEFTITVAGYIYTQGQGPDTLQLSRSVYSGNISQRNQLGTWGPVDISIFFNNLVSIKRNSVNDGTDRYLVISPFSVLLYGGINLSTDNPMVLLRKLLTPNHALIVDAVHTEADYTLVLDSAGNILRYTTANFIYTDNPDTTIVLSAISNFTFNRILSTTSFLNQRVLLLGGPEGVLILQVKNDTLQIVGTLEINTASNLLYGANNVQFIRTAGVESLHSGQILIGSILNAQATITGVSTVDNILTVICANNFKINDTVTLSGLSTAPEFNGQTVQIIAATSEWFQVSIVPQHGPYGVAATLTSVAASVDNAAVYTGTIPGGAGNAYFRYMTTILGFTNFQNNGTFTIVGSTATTITLNTASALSEAATATATIAVSETGTATATNDGQTYETLISLSQGQIISTWNSSKLKNQFVNTGEILFDPNSQYTGYPLPPANVTATSQLTVGGIVVTVSWIQQRPDLVSSYNVQYSIDGINFSPLQIVGSGSIQSISVQLAVGFTYYFQVQAFSLDGTSNFSTVTSITI
jgi:hypothetical protein